MLQVDFWRFSKRENSTKQPTSTAAASYSCLLKTGSGVVSPSLEIATSDNVSQWNYAHIPAFGRYYWVQEWTWNNGQWIAHLECDVLASYKTQIGSSTQYVERASTAYDGAIVDTLFPATTKLKEELRVPDRDAPGYTRLGQSFTDGCYIVGIINNDNTSQIGGVSYYQMTYAEMGILKNLLLSNIDYMFDSSTPAGELMKSKTEVNPFQYIVSCKWMAFNFENSNPTRTDIPLGWWNVGLKGKNINGAATVTPYVYNISLSGLAHPQASRGSYLNTAPYTRYRVKFGPFGVFDLPSDALANATDLRCEVYVDILTGCAVADFTAIKIGSGVEYYDSIHTTNGTIAVDVQLSQIIYNPQAASVPIISPIGKIGMGIISAVNSVLPGRHAQKSEQMTFLRSIGTAAGLNEPAGVVTGSLGSMAAFSFGNEPCLIVTHLYVVDDANSDVGRPLCQNKQISTLSGYIACAHVEIELPATDREAENVINYMEGGFFYE